MENENIDTQDVAINDETPWCTTIPVHISDPVTGEYRGTRDEHVVPGTGLPPECHEDAPPEVLAGHAAVRRDGSWQILPDWRGVPLWSTATGEPVQIDTIGVMPTDIGATDIERTDLTTVWDGADWVVDATLVAQRLSARQETMQADINAERNRREVAGFPYLGRTLDSTPRSVQRITAAALAAQVARAVGQPFILDWTCADNSTLPLDTAGVIGMPVALAQHAAALHAHARALKQATESAKTEAELDVIDIMAGWPGGEA